MLVLIDEFRAFLGKWLRTWKVNVFRQSIFVFLFLNNVIVLYTISFLSVSYCISAPFENPITRTSADCACYCCEKLMFGRAGLITHIAVILGKF